ncbi:SoxR reducing system RseC family protein [Magnetovirga frankeli]|uniref:SoxR reducing system RseC family protein n=1 Tax=Magnetovirga frankeli TaxID=947516 RepID=UPI0012940FF7|nr:SoxR reducing system RseC family protein [gamma proteobacterium SS-5]
MIETQARVVAVQGGRTWVQAARRSSCGQCSAAGSCGGSLFAQLFGNRPVRVEVDNPLQAQPGQGVVVGVPERLMLSGSLHLYLLPLLGLILGALLGQGLFSGQAGELPAILGALLGLFAFPALWRWLKPVLAATTSLPIIMRIQTEGLPVAPPGSNEEKKPCL